MTRLLSYHMTTDPNEPIRLCRGKCGLWKPLSTFADYRGKVAYAKCRLCRQGDARANRNNWYKQLGVEGSPERTAMIERVMAPPVKHGIPRLRDFRTKRVAVNGYVRFRSLPESLRPAAEKLLAAYLERHKGDVGGVHWQQKYAGLVAVAARMARWYHAHPGASYHAYVTRKQIFKSKLLVKLGLKPKRVSLLQLRRDNGDITEAEYQSAVETNREDARLERVKRAAKRARDAAGVTNAPSSPSPPSPDRDSPPGDNRGEQPPPSPPPARHR